MASTFTVERSATLQASPDRIFEHLSDFHRWTHWSPWEGIDPDLDRTYSGPDAGVGATYEWKGNRKVGAGRMEIVSADAPRALGIKLDFLKPFKASNDTRFTLTPAGNATQVTWTMTGKNSLMMRIMGIFMSMDKMVGKDFEKGLAQLGAAVGK